MKRYSSGLLLAMALLLTTGCQNKVEDYTDGFTPEQVSVMDFVGQLSDLVDRPGFKDYFTNPPNSKELAKFKEFKASVISVQVTGNTATAEVEIGKYGDANPPATKTWKFTKSGESWKIDDAPL